MCILIFIGCRHELTQNVTPKPRPPYQCIDIHGDSIDSLFKKEECEFLYCDAKERFLKFKERIDKMFPNNRISMQDNRSRIEKLTEHTLRVVLYYENKTLGRGGIRYYYERSKGSWVFEVKITERHEEPYTK
jgi:hypothetical protein